MEKTEINNTEWSRWYLVPEKDKKGEKLLKIKRYRTVLQGRRREPKKLYEWRHTFITENIMEEYKELLTRKLSPLCGDKKPIASAYRGPWLTYLPTSNVIIC